VPGGGANPNPGGAANNDDDRKTQDGSMRKDGSQTLSQLMGGGKKVRAARQVTEEQGRQFAQEQGLIWLGETSCLDPNNNCSEIFKALLAQVHQTQTDLVRRG